MAGVAVGLAIIGGGATALLTLSADPAARTVAEDCGLVACGAHLPSSANGAGVRSTPQASRTGQPGHRPASPTPTAGQPTATPTQSRGPSPHPSPSSPTPPPAPSPSPSLPRVTVTFGVDSVTTGHPGFHGHLTIANNGTTKITNWTLDLSLSGDTVTWAGYPGSGLPFTFWQFSGDTLTLNAVSSGESLRPGSSQTVPITVTGSTTAPGSCTFNGSACQS